MASDTETIPPALSEEEWRDVQRGATNSGMVAFFVSHFARVERYNAAAAIANAALPDDHPGKITHHRVWLVETLARHIDTQHPGGLRALQECKALAAALAALLPPRDA